MCTNIFGKQVHLIGGKIKSVASREFNVNIISFYTGNSKVFDTHILTDTIILMNDVVTYVKLGIGKNRLRSALFLFRTTLESITCGKSTVTRLGKCRENDLFRSHKLVSLTSVLLEYQYDRVAIFCRILVSKHHRTFVAVLGKHSTEVFSRSFVLGYNGYFVIS